MPRGLSDEDFAERARRLSWLLFDVDGVLTDRGLYYTGRGEEIKRFDVRDGLAFKLAQRAGLKVGILSGRRSPPLTRRMKELGVDELITDRSDKAPAFTELLGRHGLAPEQVAFAGDDLPDLPVLAACGLSFAPADAVPEVRERVHRVLAQPGGQGVGREVVELVLTARGEWRSLLAWFVE